MYAANPRLPVLQGCAHTAPRREQPTDRKQHGEDWFSHREGSSLQPRNEEAPAEEATRRGVLVEGAGAAAAEITADYLKVR